MAGSNPALLLTVAGWWHDALERTTAGHPPVSLLYSGGLDSSLVALGLRGRVDETLLTVGVGGSPDLRAAQHGARLLSLPWRGRTVGAEDLRAVLATDGSIIARASPASRSVLVGIALALDSAERACVVCGQGADELFLGYAHFEGLSPSDSDRQRREDLEKLLTVDWPLSQEIARRRGKTLISPYLDSSFLESLQALSIDQLQSHPGRKPLLRELAHHLGLPDELTERPKKAFQYGSGLDRLLRTVPIPGWTGSLVRDDSGTGFVPHRSPERGRVRDDRAAASGPEKAE
jgi:asparagine synthase (glutamine-hydrolysing)